MRNHQYAAAISRKIVFKPAERFHVQMVGWLVEEKEIRLEQQQACQTKPGLFSAAERIYVLLVLAGLEAESVQDAGNHAFP